MLRAPNLPFGKSILPDIDRELTDGRLVASEGSLKVIDRMHGGHAQVQIAEDPSISAQELARTQITSLGTSSD